MTLNIVGTVIATAGVSTVLYVLILMIIFRLWPANRLYWETIVILAIGVLVAVSVTTAFREVARLDPDTTRHAIERCTDDGRCHETFREAAR
jgi:high-affinity Fe2+/Pb2+ permease